MRGKHVRCFKGQRHPCFASCSLLVAVAAPIQLPAPAPQPGSPPREGGVSTPQPVVGGVSTADPSGSISGPGTAKPNPTPTDVSRAHPGTTPTPAETAEGEPASSVRLSFPHGITIDAQINVYIVDSLNRRIRKITPAGRSITPGGAVCFSARCGN
jgi:hypothetical protein